jgi:hypothetical protein
MIWYGIRENAVTAPREFVRYEDIIARVDELSGRPGIGAYCVRQADTKPNHRSYVAGAKGRRGFVIERMPACYEPTT